MSARQPLLRLVAAVAVLMAAGGRAAGKESVRVEPGPESVAVRAGGRLVAEYRFRDGPFPYFFPVIGPEGAALTRQYPMRDVAGEPTDHPHHRSLWFTFGDVNGHDFWSSKKGERIVHEALLETTSGAAGRITASNRWQAGETVVCTDTRSFVFRPDGDGMILDVCVTLYASYGDVVFGDSKEGAMAIRVAPSMQVTPPGKGHIVNAAGQRDKEAWGQRAAWCDYSGPVGGETVGIAIFDHPANLRHPTGWHARDYGLFAANPFAARAFGLAETPQPLRLEAGRSLTFRWRFLFHRGDAAAANIAARWKDYATESAASE